MTQAFHPPLNPKSCDASGPTFDGGAWVYLVRFPWFVEQVLNRVTCRPGWHRPASLGGAWAADPPRFLLSEGDFINPIMLIIRNDNTGWMVSTPRGLLQAPIGPFVLTI